MDKIQEEKGNRQRSQGVSNNKVTDSGTPEKRKEWILQEDLSSSSWHQVLDRSKFWDGMGVDAKLAF